MKTQTNEYLLCLLALDNNRQQRGIFYLVDKRNIGDVSMFLGLSMTLKQALGVRWEVHISKVQQASGNRYKLGQPSRSIVNIIKTLVEKIREHEAGDERTILLPAHTPQRKICHYP